MSFPNLSEEKMEVVSSDGPLKINVEGYYFWEPVELKYENAWFSFIDVAQNFLGNRRASNYKELVENILKSFRNFGFNISIKVHFSFSQLDQSPENVVDVTDEQDERFHADIKFVEKSFYRWTLKRNKTNKKQQNLQKVQLLPVQETSFF